VRHQDDLVKTVWMAVNGWVLQSIFSLSCWMPWGYHWLMDTIKLCLITNTLSCYWVDDAKYNILCTKLWIMVMFKVRVSKVNWKKFSHSLQQCYLWFWFCILWWIFAENKYSISKFVSNCFLQIDENLPHKITRLQRSQAKVHIGNCRLFLKSNNYSR
jgi:hypothetical protein